MYRPATPAASTFPTPTARSWKGRGRFSLLVILITLLTLPALGGPKPATKPKPAPPFKVLVDGAPFRAGREAGFANVDVEIDKDGTIRITTHADALEDVSSASASPQASPAGKTTASPATASPSATPAASAATATPASTPSPVPDTSPLQERYWILVQTEGTISRDWLLEVQLNGQAAYTFPPDSQPVLEVTSLLRRGDNQARISLRPKGTSPGKLFATPEGSLKVVLAPGKVVPETESVELWRPIFVLSRGAGQEDNYSEELTFLLPPPERP